MAIVACEIASLTSLCILISTIGFSGSFAEGQASSSSTYKLTLEGKDYIIRYNVTNGEITRIIADKSLLDVTVEVRIMGDGFFEITFTRQFMTHVFNIATEYLEYYGVALFVDSIELSDPQIVADCQAVTFRFPIEGGTEEIEFVAGFILADLPPSPPSERYSFLHESTAATGEYYRIRVSTNADYCDVSLDEEEKKLNVVVKSATDSEGYLSVLLPHNVLGGNYSVFVGGLAETNFNTSYIARDSISRSEDATKISLSYEGSEEPKLIEIVGTSVIPEFSLSASLSVVSAAAISFFLLSAKYGFFIRFPPQ